MATSNEIELPTPLDGAEIKEAICYKIYEAVWASLDKRSALFGKAYPKFKATFTVHYELDNFGLTHEGSVIGETRVLAEVDGEQVVTAEPILNGVCGDVEGEIPFTPPNVLRKETDQPVPTQVVNERGMQETKAVLYQPKGRRYGPKIGRGVPR